MNFLSVLYARAGITVDGVTTLNNTATGQTPATNDNSSKLATTGFVKNQNYYPYPTGTTSQYVRGDGSLATFTQTGGGGSSVSYYLNGSVSQGTIGGNTYYEMSKTAIIGTNADFTINADGYIAQFVTDAGDPALLSIPGGNWNFEMFFSASSGGGTPSFYVELYKYDGTTLTLIASGSAAPESITGGTATDLYITALAVPTTTLTLTDRLAIRVYVLHSGRTITLHTQNGHLCQVITTFTTGLTALNGLTAQVQNFAVGVGGSDFNISSVVDTHTFNLPTASATKRGALSSIDWSAFDAKVDFGDLSATAPLNYNGSGLFTIAQSSGSTNGYLSSTDWTTFNAKIGGSGTANYVAKFTSGSVVGNSIIYDNGTNVGIGTTNPIGLSANTSSLSVNSTRTDLSGGVFFAANGTSKAGLFWGSEGLFNEVLSGSALWYLGGSEKMRITSTGYLGVGTTTPLYRLESTTTALFGTTAYGVLNIAGDNPAYIKIKTNIPFSYGGQGYTVNIKGFQYGSAQTLDLQVCWHQYADAFYSQTITSKGSFAPVVRLARESGLVVIVLTWGQYWPKLYVESVHNYINDGYANGWTWVDENVTGDKVATLSYKNDFGDGFVKTAAGLVGIGTNSPSYKLDVVGTTRIQSTSYGGLIVETNDVTTIKLVSNSGSTKNWGFATTNLAVNDFGIYQSTSANGDPINAGSPILYFTGTGAATFSSSVSVNGVGLTPSVGLSALNIKETPAFPSALSMTNRNGNQVWTFAVDTDAVDDGNFGLFNGVTSLNPLKITPAGAATFSSSVTASSYIKAGADFFAQINGGIFFAGTGAYNTGVLSTNSGNDLILQSGGTGRAYLNSTGDFLVGTTSSIWGTANRGVIQVNGFSTALIGLSINNTNAGYLYHNGADLNIWNTINGVINLATSNTTRLTIAATGESTFSSNIGWGGVIPTGDGGTSSIIEGANGAQIAARNGFAQLYIGSNVVGTPYAATRSIAGYAVQLSLDALGGTISLNRAVSAGAGSAISWISNLGFTNTGAATFSSSVTATNFIVPSGTSAQFLKADGSLDSNVYLTSTSSTFSYTSSVTLSPTWQNTGVSSTNLGTGAYLVTCNADDFGVGGGQYNCTYTGLMYFFAGTTNGSNANEIVLHHSGHADQGRYIYLRTLGTLVADGKTYLQISGNGTNSGASNYQFTFKKLL
jgi:hypothetical protein